MALSFSSVVTHAQAPHLSSWELRNALIWRLASHKAAWPSVPGTQNPTTDFRLLLQEKQHIWPDVSCYSLLLAGRIKRLGIPFHSASPLRHSQVNILEMLALGQGHPPGSWNQGKRLTKARKSK